MSDETPPADVLDQLTPIGAAPEPPPRAPRRSTAERRLAATRKNATRDASRLHTDPHVAVYEEFKHGRLTEAWRGQKVMSLDEQQRLASAIVEKFGSQAVSGQETSPNPDGTVSARRLRSGEIKHFATAWGIATDKLTILQGRPTQILRVEEAEAHREPVLALVRKLAEVREMKPHDAAHPPQNASNG